jgi:uncharacterized protein (TIGR03067 family)
MRRRTGMFLVSAMMGVGVAIADPPDEAKEIRGNWKLISVNQCLRKIDLSSSEPIVLVIDAGTMTFLGSEPDRYRIDPTTNPKRYVREYNAVFTHGDKQTKVVRRAYGIFRVEKDRLTIAEYAVNGSSKVLDPEIYPTNFDPDAYRQVFVYERIAK